MCGIAGFLSFQSTADELAARLPAALETLKKRGPDAEGTYFHKQAGLGHRRLSIIDVSKDANQPFSDETGRYRLIFNGEIFNFRSLKVKLEAKGHLFKTTSDTEVLLKLYLEYGKESLQQLNGFFSFAIYDREEESLFLARDRFGVKPLHYYRDEERFLFASEIKAILALGAPKKLDHAALLVYLQLNYVPSPNTMFEGISKLEPGHFMEISANGIVVERYYRLSANNSIHKPLSYDQACVEFRNLLTDSVEKRLISDVPLGCFLSGGIDSSVVTALAGSRVSGLKTYSIGYKDEPFFDETAYAGEVAEMHKTDHTVFSLTNDDLFGYLFNMLDYLDEPFADSSALPMYILSRRTAKFVKVALSGDGADELFGGYNKHMAEWKVRNPGISGRALSALAPLWSVLPQSRNGYFSNKFRQFSRYAEGFKLSNAERYWRWCGYVDLPSAVKMLNTHHIVSGDYERANQLKNQYTRNMDSGTLKSVLEADVKLVLENDMLPKVDRMSMANSLEVRNPFLDYRVVEFAFSLPDHYKIDGRMKKKIVQDTFRGDLPESLYNRPKKGFEVPLLRWLRTELRYLIDDLLRKEYLLQQGIFDVDEVEKLKSALFSSSPGDSHARIWGLLVFQYWYKRYFLS